MYCKMSKTAKKRPNRNNSVASAFEVIVLLICINYFNSQQLVSASCISFNGQLGECVRFEECPSAVILSQQGVSPGFCNLQEHTVCCTDYRSNAQVGRLPFPEAQSSYLQKSPLDSNIENDSNNQRKKHSVIGNSNYGKRKSNSEVIDEPYKFETPNSYSVDIEVPYKPVRRPGRPSSQDEEGNFLPPGQAKKKAWREEKTTENDYFYEPITKKPSRGPSRKSSNKRPGNNNETNNSRKKTESDNEWSDQGRKRLTGNSYNYQNEYENDYSNKRTTPKRNNWEQGTYTSTRRPDFGSGPENNYAGNGDIYHSLKPTRRPQAPSSNFNTNRPNFQESLPQGSNPQYNNHNYPQGSSSFGNRPNYSQGSNFESNRPGSRPKPPKRKTISEQKCDEYSKQVTENITGLPLTTDPDPVIIPVRKCITPQQLIVGGENTTLGEFPHMAAVGFQDRNKKQISWNCGGTLISDLFVMTAGHCTSTSSGRPVKVRLGEYNLVKNDDGAYPVDYAVVEIITHPEYRPPSKYNDIALLKLSRKVTFFKHIRPACLYSHDTFSSSKAVATGWGRMNYDGATSEILQKVVLSIVDNPTCDRLYKINVKTEVLARGIVDSQMCAGELTGGKDTCQGDSGGPLTITSTKCIHHVIGITSFGKSCALPNSTGVYTRVSAYIPWIESVVWPSHYK